MESDNHESEFRKCYEVLGVSTPCDLDTLRLAWRRRVHACHPDLGSEPAREDEFKQVVHAYRRLLAFHRANGRLPLQRVSGHRLLPGEWHFRTDSRQEATGTAKSERLRMPRLLQAAFGIFVGGVASAALVGQLQGNDTNTVTPLSDGRLAIGMDTNAVVDVQGVPHHTKGSVWFYGDSGVIFDRGCVVGWENQPPFPLQTLVDTAYLGGTQTKRVAATCARRND